MHTVVEISMYPLREDYVPAIDAFIADLHGAEGVTVTTNATATQLQGEYEAVMACLQAAIARSREAQGKAVFVTKIIPGYRPGDD